MMRTRQISFALFATLFFATISQAQDPIQFPRTPDIFVSPAAKMVAFSYLGDIWLVDIMGGIARPVTMHEAHDIYPVFSPDGSTIAFSSKRHGSYDVFVVPVRGGKPKRLTFDSADDFVNGWSPDGKEILFSSSRSTDFPFNFELYAIPVEGGRVRKITKTGGRDGVFSPKGDRIAFVRGPGTWYRKGYRGSSNDDIWICSPDGSKNQQLTTFNGQDDSPMWLPDGRFLYYVSEASSSADKKVPANIMRIDAAGITKPQAITFHSEDHVRRARISGPDERGHVWIVYECGADLWVVPADVHTPPRKLAIEVRADDKSNTDRTVTFTSGASEFALSPDEKHMAFVVHGQLFMMSDGPLGQWVQPANGGKATRLTDDAFYHHGIAWSPKADKIIFTSDRNGQEDLYLLEADDPETKELVKAHKFKTKALTDSKEPEIGVSFSPDGKKVAYISAGKLITMNADGSGKRAIVSEKDAQVFDYDWSPDGKWLVYARMDGSFASELFLMPSEPQKADKPRNITRYATFNGGVTWSGNGKKLAFLSIRRQYPTVQVLSLQKATAPGVTEGRSWDIDWDDIHLRAFQPTPLPADEAAISPQGDRVAFRSFGANGEDLWLVSTDGRQLSRLTMGNQRPQQIQWSKRPFSQMIYYRDGHGNIRRTGTGGEGAILFRAKMTIRQDEEFREMFEQSWRALHEHFYDPQFHGAEWQKVREKYRPLVNHVALKEDLYALISLMMGELNASHLGIGGFYTRPEETTADLGLIFDESYRGRGLKIAEILKRGPADRRVKPGEIILKPGEIIGEIDRQPVMEKSNLAQLLNDKIGENVLLKVTSNPNADPNDPKAWRRVEIQAAGRDQISHLMYERWVQQNAKRVEELSKGRLGYIHIPSMDEHGLDAFVRSLYSDNFDKDGIVLDVRYNGGGYTHDQVLSYLGGKEHTFFRQRYGGEGMVLRSPDRKWTKPLVLLINNRSYSDAEIFPNAFRTLGLGKLIGQPTGGHVIGTSSVQLIDGSLFRVPQLGVYTIKGVNMEKQGVVPDVVIDQHPDLLAQGKDLQLDKAVEVLNLDVFVWKTKKNPEVAVQPPGAKNTGNPATVDPGATPPTGK